MYCWILLGASPFLSRHGDAGISRGLPWTFSVAAVVVAPNLKFTGLLLVPFWIALGLARLSWSERRFPGRLVMALGLAGLFGVLVAGRQPYVTNVHEHGTPFYPATDDGAGHDVLHHQASRRFAEKPRWAQLTTSLFSRSQNFEKGGGKLVPEPRLKVPMTVELSEVGMFALTDVRFGGFGPLFSGALVLAFLGAIVFRRRLKHRALLAVGAAGAVSVALLLPAGGWWARLAPQIWWLPLLFVMGAWASEARPVRLGGTVVALLLAANVALVGSANFAGQVLRTLVLREQLDYLRGGQPSGPLEVRFASYPANERRLREAGFAARVADSKCEGAAVALVAVGSMKSRTKVCVPGKGAAEVKGAVEAFLDRLSAR